MKKSMLFALGTMLILTVLTACGSGSSSVSGSITYLQKIAFPDDAVITVQIQDT
jgi:uncharacterized lipoprotein YbaY